MKYDIALFKPKRAKYTNFKAEVVTAEGIKSFVDDILGGGGDF